MVASQQVDAFGVVDLEAVEQRETLDGELSAVDVVSEEEVLAGLEGRQQVEHLDEVVVLPREGRLPVDVSDDRDAVGQVQVVRLFASSAETTHDAPGPRDDLAEVLLGDPAFPEQVVFDHADVVDACVSRAYAGLCLGRGGRGRAAGAGAAGRC